MGKVLARQAQNNAAIGRVREDCEAIMFDLIRVPSSMTAAAVSSQELSNPKPA